MVEQNFVGKSGFHWWWGVVEDRHDPKKLGRVRVRIMAIHTDDKTKIPSDELHWAFPMQPITSAAMNGIGTSPLGVVPGTHVMGFFKDAEASQEPIIMGTFGGIPEEAAKPTKGFSDPRDDSKLVEKLDSAPRKIKTREYECGGANLEDEEKAQNYPREVHPWGAVLNEPDTNRLARNEDIDDTIVQVKKDTRDLGVETAFGSGGTWDEPETPYGSVYPYNHVRETESGHIEEYDDTPGSERTHRYHRTGTFEEVYPDGSRVTKVVMDDYSITLRDNYIHICGDANVTVEGNINIYAKGDANIEVGGDTRVETAGNTEIKTGGTMDLESGGTMTLKAPRIDMNP